jgi:hypothetical protein
MIAQVLMDTFEFAFLDPINGLALAKVNTEPRTRSKEVFKGIMIRVETA